MCATRGSERGTGLKGRETHLFTQHGGQHVRGNFSPPLCVFFFLLLPHFSVHTTDTTPPYWIFCSSHVPSGQISLWSGFHTRAEKTANEYSHMSIDGSISYIEVRTSFVPTSRPRLSVARIARMSVPYSHGLQTHDRTKTAGLGHSQIYAFLFQPMSSLEFSRPGS